MSCEEKWCGRERLCASEAGVDVKPQEESSHCLVNVGWSSVLCVCPQSSEWAAVDGMGYILCLVGGRGKKSLLFCVRACVCVCVTVMWWHPSLCDSSVPWRSEKLRPGGEQIYSLIQLYWAPVKHHSNQQLSYPPRFLFSPSHHANTLPHNNNAHIARALCWMMPWRQIHGTFAPGDLSRCIPPLFLFFLFCCCAVLFFTWIITSQSESHSCTSFEPPCSHKLSHSEELRGGGGDLERKEKAIWSRKYSVHTIGTIVARITK